MTVSSSTHCFSIAPSIASAQKMAVDAGLRNCRFEVASAKEFAGGGYDLVACFDCLHDMADPAGAARHVKQSLRPDGAWLIVEPFANDAPADNLTPVGRVFYAASTLICVPASQAGDGPGTGSRVVFQAHVIKPGLYKGWGQFRWKDTVRVVPFVFKVG